METIIARMKSLRKICQHAGRKENNILYIYMSNEFSYQYLYELRVGGGGVGEKHELPYYLEFPKYNIFDQNYVKEKMICHLFIK